MRMVILRFEVRAWRGGQGISSMRGPPVIMASKVRGTSSASATCTTRKATIAAMPRKCTRRAPWKL